MIKVSTLKKNPKNPRQIKGEKLELLKKSVGSFQKMMALRPMIVDENNVVLGGNMRLAAIRALGLKEIPDEWVKRADDLTEDEKAEFIIKDNNSFGEYDWDAIANEWDAFPLSDWGLDVPGFETVDEVGNADAEPQIDKAAELNKKWKVKSGDLWQIGEHRLLCGDSTKREDVERLLMGSNPTLVTDPPYGINQDKGFAGARAFGGGKGKAIASRTYEDDWDSERPDYTTFNLLLEVSKEAVIFGGNYFADILPTGNHWVVWDKLQTMPTFSDCELAWTNVARNSVKKFTVEYNGLIGKEKERFHPTQKPVAILSAIVGEYVKGGGEVFDPFAGSGTTLVACQNLNRKCYAIEISENYCAVILERMATAFPEIEIKRIEQATAAKT